MTKSVTRIRPTNDLTLPEVRRIRGAGLLANQIGRPLNAFLTLKLTGLSKYEGPNLTSISSAYGQAIKILYDWMKAETGDVTYVSVLERDKAGGQGGGAHIHVLVHLPQNEFSTLVPKLEGVFRKTLGITADDWVVRRAAKIEFDKGLGKRTHVEAEPLEKGSEEQHESDKLVVGSLPVWIKTGAPDGEPPVPLDEANSERFLAYLCKTVDQSAPAYLVRTRRKTTIGEMAEISYNNKKGRKGLGYEPQADRPFNTVRISSNIGAGAQARAGIEVEADVGWLIPENLADAKLARSISKWMRLAPLLRWTHTAGGSFPAAPDGPCTTVTAVDAAQPPP